MLHPALVTPPDPIPVRDAVVDLTLHGKQGDPEHHGPDGRGKIDDTGGPAYGVVTTQMPPSVKGTSQSDLRLATVESIPAVREFDTRTQHLAPANWSLPKLDFSLFQWRQPSILENPV